VAFCETVTAQEVLNTVASMPREDWMKIQSGIADMIAADFSPEEVSEIRAALEESEAQFNRGEGMSIEEARNKLGLL
jgi:hypothetical protein